MEIQQHNIKVKDVFNSFEDNGEDGVFAYGGKLTIRPPYQREFIYDAKVKSIFVCKLPSGITVDHDAARRTACSSAI